MVEDFRISLFFGPNESSDDPQVLVCVFNVKKRNWKGGVQVGVELVKDQRTRLADRCLLDELIEIIRAKVEADEFGDYQQRTQDLFTQHVCMVKLNLVIAGGMNQQNQTIPADAMEKELE